MGKICIFLTAVFLCVDVDKFRNVSDKFENMSDNLKIELLIQPNRLR